MLITEDKTDRERLFDRVSHGRFTVRAKQFEGGRRFGWARKHQLWPCVRLGAGEQWLWNRGWRPGATDRRKALLFLRGHSHEALMADGESLVFVYERVGNEVDEWTGEYEAPFTEIKSTMISSARMWPTVKKGKIDLLHPFEGDYFLHYFQQCGQNCVATRTNRCRLRIFFMNGDYADRRKACPECKAVLGEMTDSIYKECPKCHYRSYAIDLRSYILEFTKDELAYFHREVFRKRRDQFYHAVEAETEADLLMRAEPTKCFLCRGCVVGKKIGCENVQ